VISYAAAYELATTDANVPGGADVPFSNNGALVNVTHTPGSAAFTVQQSGVYLLSATIMHSSGSGARAAFAVNGVVDASSEVIFYTAFGEVDVQTILPLSADDVITLRNNFSIAFALEQAPFVGARLQILQLD
jgi:hypothetical protein